MKKIIFIFIFNIYFSYGNNLTIVGYICPAEGIGSIPIRIMNCLKDNLNINWINSRDHIKPDFYNLPKYVKEIIKKNNSNIDVCIFTDLLWYDNTNLYKKVPVNSKIKYAYSMLEGNKIPSEWANILNNNFDGVIVPDKFLIDVYKNSGVNIPIFVLPLVLLDLRALFKIEHKKKFKRQFIFGNTCALVKRKNHLKLIEGFAKAFGNNQNIKLIIHSKNAEPDTLNLVKAKLHELNLKNIELNLETLSRGAYINLLNSFDCFISISQGEGFAIPPREALALGIPTILTNNTAHKTICSTGFVKSIDSNILIPATYSGFNNHRTQIGESYDCSVEDVSNALLEVYNNYDYFSKSAQLSKRWVNEYLTRNLKNKYLNLVKPKKIILGKNNIVSNDYLETNSKKLYNKYLSL